jgi:hypothetical protein
MKISRSEFGWFVPFALLGLLCVTLFRPQAETGPPVFSGETVTITDADGNRIAVPSPPVAVSEPLQWICYFPFTQAPEFLTKIGGKKDYADFSKTYLAWVFPEVLKNDRFWTDNRSGGTFEKVLADVRPGHIYFVSFNGLNAYPPAALREKFGLLAVNVVPLKPVAPSLRLRLPVDPSLMETEDIDGGEYTILTIVRVMNAALGNAAFGETLIEEFLAERRLLHDEFMPETIPENERPRVMGVIAPPDEWSRLSLLSGDNERTAVRYAIGEYRASGRESEAERLLAIDPDAIGAPPEEFRNDPRWRGLTAVREGRIYTGKHDFGGRNWDIDHVLLNTRKEAELYHPERYEPGVLRERIRERYRKRYNYEITEDQLDILLSVPENAASVGYERFMRRK